MRKFGETSLSARVRASQNDNDDDDNDFEEEKKRKRKEDDTKCSFWTRLVQETLHSPNDTRVRVHLLPSRRRGGGGKREEEEEERKQILLRLQEEIGRVFAL